MNFEKTRYTSVWKKQLKNGDISYYITYREKGNSSPKRKRVGTKRGGMTAKEAREKLVNNQKYFKPLHQSSALEKNDYAEYYKAIRGDKVVTLYVLAFEYFVAGIEKRFGTTMALMRQTEEYKNGKMNPFGKSYEVVDDMEHLSRLLKALAAFTNDPIEANKIRNYHKNIRRFIINIVPIREFKNKPLDELDITLTTGCEYYWRDKGKSEKTIADNFHMIKAIINWSYQMEAYKGKNFLANHKIKTGKKKRDRYLTEKEVVKLMTKLKEKNSNVYLSAYLALITGGRASTVLNIQKKHIDFETKKITLQNIKKKRVYQVPFSEDKEDYLKEIVKHLDEEDYLIHSIRMNADRKKPLSKIPPKYYEVATELFNSGLDPKKDRLTRVNFHTLRHTAATLMVKNKVDLYEVSKFLDHTSIEETQRYAQLDSDDLISAASTIKLPSF